MSNSLPSVDVVVVNYNGLTFIDQCLAALMETDYPAFHVIMVDNGSSDGSVELVRRKYPGVRVVCNERNLGFGAANEIGMGAGDSDLVAFLNNDTVVDRDWLRSLAEVMFSDDSIAAACSKLLLMDHPRVLNAAGGGMNYLGIGFDHGIFETDSDPSGEPSEVFFPCAAACLVRRSAFDAVGGFDEKFFMYHEDVDLGWRFWLRGYRVVYVPRSVVAHAFGGTSLRVAGLAFRNYLGMRHALRSLLKNYSARSLFRILPEFIGSGLRSAVKTKSWSFLKCLAWNLAVLPDTVRKRREIQAARKVGDADLGRLIWQERQLPVTWPDYEMMTLDRFREKEVRTDAASMDGNDRGLLGYGWYGSEIFFGDGVTPYRWTRDEAVLYLWNASGGGTVSIDLLSLSETLGRRRGIGVSVNGGAVHDYDLSSDGWETVTVPCDGEPGPCEVRLNSHDVWVPHDAFRNGDRRRLGVGVRKAAIIPGKTAGAELDGISVIIPTYNRIPILLKTLHSLEIQSLPREAFEVIVIDDGSTDATGDEMHAFMDRTSLNVRYFRQDNKKQGAARNLGIRHARRDLLIFIGDDIVLSPSFLEEHLGYHRKNNLAGNLVVIGRTQWPDDVRVTPFMNFVNEYGYQFGYSLIQGEGPLPFNFFYTSNISLARSFLEELDFVFEEDFKSYGWEDIELGYRLDRIGMKLCYNRKAVAYHYHQMDIPAFCLRQFNVGRASRAFLQKHPELSWFLGSPQELRRLRRFRPVAAVLEKVLHFADSRMALSPPQKVFDFLLRVNYAAGAVAGEG